MTPAVLAAAASLQGVAIWAQVEPEGWLLTAIPQLGAIALLLWFGNRMLDQANQRTEAERAQRIADVAMERTERREAEARERQLAASSLPALQEANRALDMVTRLVERGQT